MYQYTDDLYCYTEGQIYRCTVKKYTDVLRIYNTANLQNPKRCWASHDARATILSFFSTQYEYKQDNNSGMFKPFYGNINIFDMITKLFVNRVKQNFFR